MKNLNSILITTILIFSIIVGVNAQNTSIPKVKNQVKGNGVPATKKLIKYKQPDGSILNLYLKGDKAIHWAETTDGYTIIANSIGFYEYAKIDENGNLVSTNVVAKNESERTITDKSIVSNLKKASFYSEKQIKSKKEAYTGTQKSDLRSFPVDGNPNFLVLLIQFSDLSFTFSLSDLDNLLNQTNYGGIGSFKDYYNKNSNGKLNINTLVDGIYTAPYNHDYYGQNDANGYDMYVEELVSDLVSGADSYIDFSQYDNDGDAIVDGIYVIYAGTGEASSADPNDIWPHNMPSITPILVDGVWIESYTCSNELSGTALDGIGTICHEFGHALGLPDFYDTDYEGSGGQAEGTGTWDVMDGGCYNGNGNTPANHNPYSKQMLGWQTTKVISSNGSYVLPAATQDTIAYVIKANGYDEEFYLENRQWEGFDYELQSHGMLIYHCDLSYLTPERMDLNDINVDPLHQGFDLEEADNENTDETGDTYPGNSINSSFTDATNPSSMLWASANFNYPIVNIAENSSTGNITFDVSGFVGINDVYENENVQIYPSLANNFVEILSKDKIQEISIVNIQGQELNKITINDFKNRIDVSKIENGTYFVLTKTLNNQSISKIIVIH